MGKVGLNDLTPEQMAKLAIATYGSVDLKKSASGPMKLTEDK